MRAILGLGLLLAVQSIAAFPQAAVIIEAELPDFVAVEAAGQDEARQGRLVFESPEDDSAPGVAGFRLPRPQGRTDEDLEAVIVEVGDFDESKPGFQDIPRDRSGSNEAGFRLPLPEQETTTEPNEELSPVLKAGFTKDIRISSVDGERDFVVVEAASEDDLKGRIGIQSDIPRDGSGLKKAGFRLPLPDDQVDDYDGAVIVEAGDEVDSRGRIGLESGIPRDLSGLKKAGFRLPLPDDQVNYDY